MRKIIAALVVMVVLTGFVHAESDISSKIEKVVLFKDSALIKRAAKATMVKGENIIKFKGLTTNIIDNSVQISMAENIAKIMDVKVEKSYISSANEERKTQIINQINTIEKKIKLLEHEKKALENYIEIISKTKLTSQSPKSTGNELENAFKFIETNLKNNYREIANIELEIESLNEEKDNLKKELSSIGGQIKESKNIIVTLKAIKEGESKIEISYIAKGAGWNPLYNVNADTSDESIIFDVYANITQSTGEDWNNVLFEISTSKSVSAKFTDITPWYVDIYKPEPVTIYKEMRMSKSIVNEGIEDKTEPESEKPALTEEGISFNFALQNTITVPSDNQPHKVYLASSKISKTNTDEKIIKYLAIPKKSPYVFLTGFFKNPFDFPLFPGKINVSVDGKFLNTETLSVTKAPAEDVTLPLGADESLKITMKMVKKFTEYSGIVSKSEKKFYEYEIVVQNGKSKGITLEVKDSYPISLNEQIKTTLELPTEKEASISKDGIIIWTVDVPSKSVKKLNLKFTVEYPKELKISGID